MMKIIIEHELTADDESFIQDVVLNVDLFRHGYCGYWLRGERHTKDGWIATYERDAGKRSQKIINRVFALSVLKEGIKQHGIGFSGDYDGPTLDCAVQTAMFGEVVFG